MQWLVGILINAILFIALAGYFEQSLYIESFAASLVASFVFAILNLLVKPFLIILTLPITFISLGLFLFVINGITLFLTDSIMGDAFEISSFGMAILIAAIISFVNLVIQNFLFSEKKKK